MKRAMTGKLVVSMKSANIEACAPLTKCFVSYEEEMGGASQNLVEIVDGRAGELAAEDSEDDNELEVVNHGDFFRDDRGGAAIEEGEDG